MTDTSTVSIEVKGLMPGRGGGKLLAWAVVELMVDGVSITLQGITVMRRRDSLAEVVLPSCRTPDGSLAPAVVLPDELEDAVMRAILAEVSPNRTAVPVQTEA